MNMGQEQIDFFTQLNLHTDWRGAIYEKKTQSNSETVSGVKERPCEAKTETQVAK